MPDLIYEPIPQLSESQISKLIQENDERKLATAALSAALYLEDGTLAQKFCLQLAMHSNPIVRGNAVLGFGHIARIDRKLDEGKVRPIIEKALRDADDFVRGQAESAKEDIEFVLGWSFETN